MIVVAAPEPMVYILQPQEPLNPVVKYLLFEVPPVVDDLQLQVSLADLGKVVGIHR
jgi:hypothetical protein